MLQRYGYIGVKVGTVEAYTAASIWHSACRGIALENKQYFTL